MKCICERYNKNWESTSKLQQGKYSDYLGQKQWVSMATFEAYNIDHDLNEITQVKFSFDQDGGSSSSLKQIDIFISLNKSEAQALKTSSDPVPDITIYSLNGSRKFVINSKENSSFLPVFQEKFALNKNLVFYSVLDKNESVDKIDKENTTSKDYTPNYLSLRNFEMEVTYQTKVTEKVITTDVILGSTNTVQISNSIPNRWYQVTWKLGNKTYIRQKIQADSTSTSTSITSSTQNFSDWGEEFKTSSSASGLILLDIYDSQSSTTPLDTKTYSVLFKVPETGSSPTITNYSFNTKVSYYNSNNQEVYLKNLSQIEISASFLASYGADISSISISYGDNVYLYSGDSISGILVPLTTKGTITIKVTDSRGKTASRNSSEYTVIDANLPSLSDAYEIQRCDADGTVTTNGTYIKFTGTINNAQLTTSFYKEPSATSWKTFSWNSYVSQSNLFSTDKQYDIKIVIKSDTYYTDKLNPPTPMTVSYSDNLSSAAYLLHFLKGGKSIGIGCAAQQPDENESLITMGWPVKVNSSIDVTGVVNAKSFSADLNENGTDGGYISGVRIMATKQLRSSGNVYAVGGEFSGDVKVNNLNVDTDAAGEGGMLRFNKIQGGHAMFFGNVEIQQGKLIYDRQNYSTEAVDTGNTWIDGKNIFRQTFTVSVTAGSNNQIKHLDGWSVGVQNNAMVTDMHGMLYGKDKDDFYRFYPLNMPPIGQNYNRAFVDNQGHIWFHAAYTGIVYITVFFTKPD